MKPRKIFPILYNEKNKAKHTILIGARQVGKTTILRALFEKICKEEGEKGLFLDIDVYSQYEQVATLDLAINTFKLHGYREKSPFFVFLDEFQRHEDLSMLLKNLYDHHPEIKVYATGSSSLMIKDRLQDSLAGRKFLHLLYPLCFEEYLMFKGDDLALSLLQNVPNLQGNDLHKVVKSLIDHLKDFLIFGSYPEVTLASDEHDKIEIIKSIFDIYAQKELIEYLHIKKILPIKQLITHVAVNNGQKIKYEEVSQVASLSVKTVKNYLQILEETFLVKKISPFFTNKNKEIVKVPKIYFIDCGVRNFFIQNFAPIHLRQEAEFLFETFILGELLKKGMTTDQIKFWQDKNKNEVDFVIDSGSFLLGLEVKWKNLLKKRDFKGLRAFKKNYQQAECFLINLGQQIQTDEFQIMLPFSIDYFLDKYLSQR